MRYVVKCFTEVKDYCVNLLLVVHGFCEVLSCCDQLRLAGSARPESMLQVSKDLVVVVVIHNLAEYDMFN